MATTDQKRKKKSPEKATVPLSWRVYSLLALLPVGIALFSIAFHSRERFLITRQDRLMFALGCGLGLPFFLYSVISRIMKAVILKRSSSDIARELAVDAAVSAIDFLTDSSGDASRASSSSSSEGAQGGGGDFGGGGASGNY